ncbi:MAG: HAD family hydrolase [Anaerolineales bacterium]
MMEWIAFDADDTLWKNEETYLNGRDVLLEILSGYGVVVDDPEEFDQLEVNNIKYYGYGVMSFVLSLIEVAIDLTDAKISPGDIRKLLDLGKVMLAADVEVFKGVMPLLETLSKRYSLMLITKGDLFHQQRKIQSSGLGEYFQLIEVVSDKSSEVYLEILDRYQIDPGQFVMIGNSMRSDIVPVLELGGWAIHLTDHLSWSHENDFLDDENKDRFQEVAGISKVQDALNKLENRGV